jgi:3-dehydroquinate synthase
MESLRCEFSVPFAYDVVFGEDVFAGGVIDRITSGGQRVIVAEGAVMPLMRGIPDVVVMDGGEAAKRDSAVFDRCVELFEDLRLDRHAYVVIVGGGAFLDAVGFAASVVHRGIRQIRVPTTVLSQCDGGVGVKNGIDAFGQKNFLGTFAPPWAVVNDWKFLETLPDAVFRDGFAEAVKVGLIRDGAFFEWIEAHADALAARDKAAAQNAIHRCAELHLNQIAKGGDPFERGSARPLDFGHWAAHKLEVLSNFRLSHGSAVAIGMVLDTLYAERVGIAPQGTVTRVRSCLERLGFELCAGFDVHPESLLKGLQEFREHLGGRLAITLLTGIGQAVEVSEIDLAEMTRCMTEVLAHNTHPCSRA